MSCSRTHDGPSGDRTQDISMQSRTIHTSSIIIVGKQYLRWIYVNHLYKAVNFVSQILRCNSDTNSNTIEDWQMNVRPLMDNPGLDN